MQDCVSCGASLGRAEHSSLDHPEEDHCLRCLVRQVDWDKVEKELLETNLSVPRETIQRILNTPSSL